MFEYLCDEEDNILVDKVFRLENLSQDSEPMADFLNIPDFRLRHKNKTDTKKQETYTEWYDVETIQAVANIYRKDIDIFEYEYS